MQPSIAAKWGSMQIKSIPWWLWLLSIVVLLIATWKMPYGYYTLTRVVVCGVAALLAFASWQEETSTSKVWSAVFGVIAVFFNPIFPIYLKRVTWFYFDVGGALIFAAHLAFVRLSWLGAKRS
jgi:hypothetical protein